MIAAEVLATIGARIARNLAPPPGPPSLIEFARSLVVTEGDDKGPYRPEAHAPQWFFLSALSKSLAGESPFRRFVLIKPTQDGGTLVSMVIPALYLTGVLGDPFIIGVPDMRLAGINWRQKLRPTVRSSGRASWLPVDGPGSDGGSTPTEVAINGTPLYYVGAGASNEAGQSSLTGRGLGRDERDSMDTYLAELMTGRTDSYGDRRLIVDTSTIKHDTGSPILGDWESSTAAHVEYACPFCGAFVWWEQKHMVLEGDGERSARDAVYLRCPHCEGKITDVERGTLRHPRMLALANARLVGTGWWTDHTGHLEGTLPDKLVFGVLWTAFDSPRITLTSLAEQYLGAMKSFSDGDPAALRRYARDRECRPFKDASKPVTLTAKALHDLSVGSDYDAGELPADVEFLALTIDVQLRWHYWWVEGWNRDGRSWLIAASTDTLVHHDGNEIPHDQEPSQDERYVSLSRIEAIANNGWVRRSTGEVLSPLVRGIDIGFRQTEVRLWLKDHPHWNAVKGVGEEDNDDQVLVGKRAAEARTSWHQPSLQRDQWGEWTIWNIYGHNVKGAVQSAYLKPDGPGAARLPRGLAINSAVCRHLVAERSERTPTGQIKWVKVSTGAANHFLDCAVYGRALSRAHIAATYPADAMPAPPPRSAAPERTRNDSLNASRRASRLARRSR